MEDEKIVQLYVQRDESAIAHTAEKYGPRLRKLAFTITGNEQTAEECENDTYLEAWRRIPPAQPESYLFAFLARITRAAAIDRCRAQTSLKRSGYVVALTEELSACLPSGESADEALAEKLLGEAISRFLRTLSDEKQVIFLRRYFYLEPISAIAQRLHCSESKVKMTLLRLRRDLKTYLIKEGFTP